MSRVIFTDELGRLLSPSQVRAGTVEAERTVEAARQMEELARDGDELIDRAIGDGRLPREDRPRWRRLFQEKPSTVVHVLQEIPPNPETASRNSWTEEKDEAYRRDYAARWGEEPEV